LAFYDIFNGDADGICALQQLRLAQPRASELVTGVKRDVALVSRIYAAAGDELTVLDISLAENRDALLKLLAAGARCIYFDHHFAGDVPVHAGLEAHIRPVPGTCTSLLVDEYLGGRFRAWAVVAAFGDNLPQEAARAAMSLEINADELATLRELGECLNYNAYGDTLEDLYFHPAELYRRLHRFADPLWFAAQDPAFERLRAGLREDLTHAARVSPLIDTPTHYVVVMPDEPWGRRVHGPWANRLATKQPQRAHAVLIEHEDGYRVSVRAPLARPFGTDELCRTFPTGGGRAGAAGINRLPRERLGEFVSAFRAVFHPEQA
jgi:hypothetical protein